MRLISLELAGFRGFASEQTFDLDADAIVVVGANGNGKTSLFDAVLWALSGRVPRLGNADSLLVCRFSETGQARVVLKLSQKAGLSPITVTRIFDGKETKVSIETGGEVLRGPEAEGRLVQMVWKEAANAANPAEALATVLTRSVYLQQDLVREFIDSVTEQERFTAISELVGAGRITELQGDLERAKIAWSRTTNSRISELHPARIRLSAMESRLAELKMRSVPTEGSLDEAAWSTWWLQLPTLGLTVSPVSLASREAAGAIDAAVKQLDAVRRSAERKLDLLDALNHELGGIAAKPKPDLVPLRDKVAFRKQQIQDTRDRVSAEQARVADVRRTQAELKEKSEQLRALATLALKHLGEKCPVCNQEYDIDATRHRLELTANAASSALAPPPRPETLPALLATLASQEKNLSTAELELRTAEQAARTYEATDLAIKKRFGELGLEPAVNADRIFLVKDAALATHRQVESLVAAQRTGENLALRLSRAGDQANIQELQREIGTAGKKLQEEDKEIARRIATGEQAQRVIEALREAASRIVTEQVKEIEPLLRDVYSRIDVHPAFRVVRFLGHV